MIEPTGASTARTAGHGRGLEALLVFVIVLGACLWRLGGGPLAGTEAHRAIGAHQMAESGQWLVPQLWDQPYLRKPPLHYWVLAATERLAGRGGEWLWRLPSAVASALLAVLLFLMADRWFGRPAGLIAGLSYLGLVALWSQSRKADLDALHTLAVVASALFLLELGAAPPGRRWRWVLPAGLSFGAALLLKGPAGLPVIVGAVVGPPLVNRTWKRLRRPHVWVALLSGTAIFGAWALAAYQVSRSGGRPADLSGLGDLVHHLTRIDADRILKAITLPLVLAAYALPLSLAVPIALLPDTAPTRPVWRRVRGLGGAVVVALMAGVLGRVVNPRYMFIVMPLLCPLAGAIGVAWKAGVYHASIERLLRTIMGVTAVVLAAVNLGLAGTVRLRFEAQETWLLAAAGMAVVAGVWTMRCWSLRRHAAGSVGMVVLLLLLMFPFAALKVHDRIARSSYRAALELRSIIGASRVTAGHWVLNGPELFHYAEADVDFRRHGLTDPVGFSSDRWVVFHSREWKIWEARMPERFKRVTVLGTRRRNAILAWYVADPAEAAAPERSW